MTHAPDPVDQAAIDDLRDRLRRTRRIPLIAGTGWERGTDTDFLTGLLEAWAEYDWRPHEQRLLALPWRTTAGGMRLIDQPAEQQDAPVVVLLHGWPDSFLRYERVLPLLRDVRVVVPCLPGYPYGLPVRERGLSTGGTADLVAAALHELGVDRAIVSGGDIGASVAESLAADHPGLVGALHLTNIPTPHYFLPAPDDATAEEQEALAAAAAWDAAEAGYSHEQATKPHTLAVGLGDSPAGLAAWVVEKLRDWSDCDGDLESVFAREDLLTWLSLMWFTGTIGTSFTPYVEERETGGAPGPVPVAFTWFPKEMLRAPRSFAERFFSVRVWEERPRGGHFAAWEQPESFVEGLRSAIALAG